MRKERKSKNIIEKFFDELIFVITNFLNNIFTMKVPTLFKFLFELAVIIVIVYIVRVPFVILNGLVLSGVNIVLPVSKVITVIWDMFSDTLYWFIAVTLFVYLYKKRFQKYKVTKNDKEQIESNYEEIYKSLIILVSIPLFMLNIMFIICLILAIYLVMIGIMYYGPIIVSVSAVIVSTLLTVMVIRYLMNKKNNNKLVKYLAVSSLIILMIGCVFLTKEINSIKYYKTSVPIMDYTIKTDTIKKYIDDKIKVVCDGCYEEYELVIDNKLNGEIIVEVTYYDEYVKPKFVADEDLITISGTNINIFNKTMRENLKNNLKNNQLYNYLLLYKKNLTIYINENDKEKIVVDFK